ncbi:MAG TPA: hypothetical protein VMT03_17905, partial [Polyangia bacterium]|nr:hypothetical protein [Polyangia bacterium]
SEEIRANGRSSTGDYQRSGVSGRDRYMAENARASRAHRPTVAADAHEERADLDAVMRGSRKDELATLTSQVSMLISGLSGWLQKLAPTEVAAPPVDLAKLGTPAPVGTGPGERVAAVRRLMDQAIELFHIGPGVDRTAVIREASAEDLAILSSQAPVLARIFGWWASDIADALAARQRGGA